MLALSVFFVFLVPIAVIGIPYRLYQIATGHFQRRLASVDGFSQLVVVFGLTLVFVNVFLLGYAIYLACATFTTTSNGYDRLFTVVMVVCGTSYAVMEALLLPLTVFWAPSKS
ncbi:hypothetical protein W02_42420 [Nitrospira sp. KM1]|uniref:hypothetical protein n=1 Tax=Nitrospira sp. KM1 TaxID=1936990 RepID=UPI0013A77F74|nr:hypothetical protein [Nitrospira sp. KM1]BCA57102.1 hypothetical protein W02_42420 [Nitrospira sp. KM1]